MKLALVGATGLVGQEMLKLLQERNFPLTEFFPVASEKSVGKSCHFQGKEHKIMGIEQALELKPDIALFSAGSRVSMDYAPRFAEKGCIVIDNSSAWRMDPTKKLIVPEINGNILRIDDRIIANPNCSTIQMVMALAPLHKSWGIRRIVVSTYQSVTGTGKEAVDQLQDEIENGHSDRMVYPHPIHKNALPHVDVFLDNGYTKEEMKMVNETRKILGDDNIEVTATCVRLPIEGGHAESVNVEFQQDYTIDKVYELLHETPGVTVLDEPSENLYPMPITAQGKDEVYVGRIRRDESQQKALNLWIVADNLRKGAATNTVQIAEFLLEQNLIF
jgi:aspartate-semialdehyde dehydrogenase